MRVQPRATSFALSVLWLGFVFDNLAASSYAFAQNTPLSGSWRAGATSIDVQVESWGGDCGPRPQSTHSAGGGLVSVEQKDQVLLVHGRDQDIRSDACWSRNPAIKRTSASYTGGVWTTHCKTSDADPKAEQGTYTLKLVSNDALLYQDVSHYDWSLNESKCVATFTTSQTLSRAAKGGKAEPIAKSVAPQKIDPIASAAASDERVCTPGAPAHLALRPRHIDIEVGQRTCFHARVTDATDCAIRDPDIEWLLLHNKALRGSVGAGCFTAATSAAEAQGDFKIVARLVGMTSISDNATVTVRPIDLSALIAKRMEGSGVTGFDENGQPLRAPKAVARIATQSSAATTAGSGRRSFVFALGGLAIVLAIVGLWYSRRSRSTSAAISGSTSVSSIPPPLPSQRSDPPPAARADGEEGEDSEAWICPTCRVGYPAQQITCPKDGTKLIPYVEFTKRGRQRDEEHAKRCPKCGRTYPASAAFCGNDGSSLVDSDAPA